MHRNLFTAWILSAALPGIGNAQGTVSSGENSDYNSRSQLKQVSRDERAPEHYRSLADYYRERQKCYLQKAADEKQEWERSGQNMIGIQPKASRPADSARGLYEHYMAAAAEAGKLEAKYSQLATPDILAKVR